MYNVIIPAAASLASDLVPTKPTDMADSICIPYNAPQKKAFFLRTRRKQGGME